MKKSLSKPTAEGKDFKVSEGNTTNGYLCYNCMKHGHFIKDCPYPESKRYTDKEKTSRVEKKKRQEKERIRTLLSEFENTKEASPSSSKLSVESDSENSTDSEDNEALICLMVKEEEVNSSESVLTKNSPDETIYSLLLLMEDVKVIKSENETLTPSNFLTYEKLTRSRGSG
ncbi:hypothetical protein ACS0TY_016915 [Phlomoides rotata]